MSEKTIQLKDFLNYKFLSNVQMSPDKSSCIFQVTTCDEEKNAYNSNIYLWQNDKCMPLTQSNKDNGAFYLDEDTILFKSTRDSAIQERMKNGEELTSFYKLSLKGGEAQKYFEIPLSVSSLEKINENEFLVLASYDRDYSIVGREDQKEELLKAKKEEQDYEVFTKIPFCHNGGGYAANTVSRLYIYNVGTKCLKPISPEDIDIFSYHMKPDKSEVVVVGEKDNKRVSMRSGVYTYHFAKEEWSEKIPEEEYWIDAAYYFNDGILALGNKEWKHGYNENSRFFFLNQENQISLFYDNQESFWNPVGSDCRFGGGRHAKVCGEKFYYISTRNHNSHVMSIDIHGNVREEIVYEGSVDCFDVCQDTFVYIGMKDGALQELYRKAENDEKLTSLNQDVLAGKYVASYEEIKFENDGYEFTGWVLLPKDYDPDKKYPAIFDIHGGPKTTYGNVFYHEMQLWANMGYFVFFTNPRGSDGRGNDFMDIFGKYGTIDYEDLMKFADVVLDTYPAIDREKVGVTGGSYGGFMTNWIISHTDRFACAATQRSISNWISFYGTSDIGMFFAEDQIRGNIFENPEKLWEHSPLKYAKNIKTPTLFIHSDEDHRCPLEQGLQLYTAIVDRGVEARFVLFHGENHELSRGGKPKHRVRRLEEITGWMEKHLKG